MSRRHPKHSRVGQTSWEQSVEAGTRLWRKFVVSAGGQETEVWAYSNAEAKERGALILGVAKADVAARLA